ncbi:MAG: lysophospholipid acyltransferase family protein [Candidatus Margulisiibacteriota bacterium]|nr:lysophospholipid acyltransferase family protein [Candidatus Margulisiibacteriota bacterium]
MSRYLRALLRLQSFLSWIFCVLVFAPVILVISRFYSIKVYGKGNLGNLKGPLIIVSNHLTLIDSLFIGFVVAFPQSYWKPRRLTWHLPEATNYSRGMLAPLVWLGRSIPILRNVPPGEQKSAKDKVICVLKNKELIHIFPEGTRSRTGRVESFTNGIGRIYMRVPDCRVLPVYIRGSENVLPVNCKFPKLFKKIDIVIGKPQKLASEQKGLRAAVDISEQIYAILKGMENEYFEGKMYRASEIIGENTGCEDIN